MTAVVFTHAPSIPSGYCPDCWGLVPLDPDGTVGKHNEAIVTAEGTHPGSRDCGGRGSTPLPTIPTLHLQGVSQ